MTVFVGVCLSTNFMTMQISKFIFTVYEASSEFTGLWLYDGTLKFDQQRDPETVISSNNLPAPTCYGFYRNALVNWIFDTDTHIHIYVNGRGGKSW